MSYLPQEGPTSRAHASRGKNKDRCRARMMSSLNSSVMDRHTLSSARWRRMHTSPAVRATCSSFVSLWEKSDHKIREGTPGQGLFLRADNCNFLKTQVPIFWCVKLPFKAKLKYLHTGLFFFFETGMRAHIFLFIQI